MNIYTTYKIVDDSGFICYLVSTSRTEAIEKYAAYRGCPTEYVKAHCLVKVI